MQERGVLFFGVRLDLVQLDHARLYGLLMCDAALVRVLHAQLAQPVPQGVRGD